MAALVKVIAEQTKVRVDREVWADRVRDSTFTAFYRLIAGLEIACRRRVEIRVQPFTEDWTAAVRDFNLRLTATGKLDGLAFPEHHIPDLPRSDAASIFQEYYLAVERDTVRGAFCLTFEPWCLSGQELSVSHYRLPMSEGIRDRAYKVVGAELVKAALARQPFLYSLGMGGFNRPMARGLRKMGWAMCAIPFLFKIVRPQRVLQGCPPLRATRFWRLATNAALVTGAGWLAIKAHQELCDIRRGSSAVSAERVGEFAQWSDAVWRSSSRDYAYIARRDCELLNTRYGDQRFIRLRVRDRDRTIGWAVLLDTPMRDNRYFGSLRVGTIVDMLARSAEALGVARAATRELETRGVDLVVSNQSHGTWLKALARNGFLKGPSNFVFAASPPLAARLGPLEQGRPTWHLTRGDGPGPTRL